MDSSDRHIGDSPKPGRKRRRRRPRVRRVQTERTVSDNSKCRRKQHHTKGNVSHKAGSKTVPKTAPQPVAPDGAGTGEIHKVMVSDTRGYDNLLPVQLGNLHTTALCDTGATISCMAASTLAKIKPKYVHHLPNDVECVMGVGGKTHKITAKVEVQMQIQNQRVKHVFYCLPHQQQMILGMDFLQGSTLDFGKSVLTMPDGTSFQLRPPAARSTLVRIAAKEIIIPGKRAAEVDVALLNKHLDVKVIEPLEAFANSNPDVIVYTSLVNGEHPRCLVINTSPQPARLVHDKPIGIARSISVNTIIEHDEFSEPVPDDELSPTDDDQADSPLSFNINANMSQKDQREYKFILDEAKDRFSVSLETLGSGTDLCPLSIDTDAGEVQRRAYRTSPKIEQEIQTQVADLLKYSIIEPATHCWRSPVVLTKKKDGTYRFAVDYRDVNKKTKKMSFPVPRVEDVWDTIAAKKAKVFSTLDLSSGYWQLDLDPATKHKTGFVTKTGSYQFRKLPFGLRNAPANFQKNMTHVLDGLINDICIIYVDDIIVLSPDHDTHKKHLKLVLERLRKHNLTLKPSKCHFAMDSVKYIGHILSGDGISTDPELIEKIRSFPAPKNPKQVQQFNGLTNYYRRFVKDLSKLQAPLNILLQKDEPWAWTDACEQAFQTIKRALVSPPTLAYPDLDKPFILTTDASTSAIGHILSQLDDDGKERIVACGGRGLRKSERNYSITDLEALAVVDGFKNYHTYLADNHTTVITDHAALQFIESNKNLTGRAARWAVALQGYEKTIKYRPGLKNENADALSRREYPPEPDADEPWPDHADIFNIEVDIFQETAGSQHKSQSGKVDKQTQSCQAEVLMAGNSEGSSQRTGGMTDQSSTDDNLGTGQYTEVTFEYHDPPTVAAVGKIDIKQQQMDCPEVGPIYRYFASGIRPADKGVAHHVSYHEDKYGLQDGVLMHVHQPRKGEDRPVHQLVMPRQLRPAVLSEHHDSLVGGCHQGFQRTYEAIRRKYYWRRMYADIEEYVRTCDKCQRAKSHQTKNAKLHPLPIVDIFERWHIDFIGPLHQAADGSKYILVVVDSMSKWCEAFALRTADAHAVAAILYKEIFCRYGAPTTLVSDRGAQFMSSLVNALCDLFSVKRAVTSAYHPQTNAQVERFNAVINAALRTYVNDEQDDWPVALPGIMMAYRKTPATRSTGVSPYFMLYGKEMKTPLDAELLPANNVALPFRDHFQGLSRHVDVARKVAQEQMRQNQERFRDHYDRTAEEPSFREHDLVFIRDPVVQVGHSAKLHQPWKGPYQIVEVCQNSTYVLRNMATRELLKSRIHANRMKLASAAYESAIRNEVRRQNQAAEPAPDAANEDARQPNDQNAPGEVDSDGEPHDADADSDQSDEDTDNGKLDAEMVADVSPDQVIQVKRASKYKGRLCYSVLTSISTRLIWVWEESVPMHLKWQFFRNYTQSGKKRKRALGNNAKPYFKTDAS